MEKYVIAAVLVVSFAAPAFAEQFYVAFDHASHKCVMMHNVPRGMKRMGGPYASKSAAHKAMASMKGCGYIG